MLSLPFSFIISLNCCHHNKAGLFYDFLVDNKSTPSGYMKIVDRFTKYMIILSCEFVEGRDLSINGFVLGTASSTWNKDNIDQLIPTMNTINESIQKYLISLKGTKFANEIFRMVTLTQNNVICDQYNPTSINSFASQTTLSHLYIIVLIFFLIQ